jgi:hypothetical protein
MANRGVGYRRAVVTVLFGDYETVREQPFAEQSECDFLCVTDNPEAVTRGWTPVVVKPEFSRDLPRSQRLVKIMGHEALRGYDEILHIDASVELLVDPREILDVWLEDADVALPHHSYRASLVDEFDAVIAEGRDQHERVAEQLFHYHQEDSDLLAKKPLWTGMYARRRNSEVAEFQRRWFAHVARYSRRDQLSVHHALSGVPGLKVNIIEIDNRRSDVHRWDFGRPDRPKSLSHASPSSSLPALAEVARLRRELAQAEAAHSLLQKRVNDAESQLAVAIGHSDNLQSTLSWRITRPLRWLREFPYRPNLWGILFPRVFRQKIRRRMAFDRRPVLREISDKVAVRDYVANKVGTDALVRIFACEDSPLTIKWENLPREFVVKVSHGSGGIIIVWDGAPPDNEIPADPRNHPWATFVVTPAQFSAERATRMLEFWLGLDYSRFHGEKEWAYRGIPPRVIVEELLLNHDGSLPTDIKFFMFDGELELFLLERAVDGSRVRISFTPDGGPAVPRAVMPDGFEVPENLAALKQYAAALSKDFDFIRVDLYSVRGEVKFGELTAYPARGQGDTPPGHPYQQMGKDWKPHIGR